MTKKWSEKYDLSFTFHLRQNQAPVIFALFKRQLVHFSIKKKRQFKNVSLSGIYRFLCIGSDRQRHHQRVLSHTLPLNAISESIWVSRVWLSSLYTLELRNGWTKVSADNLLQLRLHCKHNFKGASLSNCWVVLFKRPFFQLKKNWACQDLNLGLLGEKGERYLCAMPTPYL